jgi:hypothetical protein
MRDRPSRRHGGRRSAGSAGGVHVIDGDGASLREVIPTGALVQMADSSWADIAPEHRCGRCQALLASFGMGHV